MSSGNRYLGPAWKFLNIDRRKMVDTKQHDILKEYCDLDDKYLKLLYNYGKQLGLAFQVVDDI